MGKYVKKTQKTWSEEDMENAIKAFRQGRSLRHAAELFKVPRTCLTRRLNNNDSLKKRGGQSVFTPEQERALADRIVRLCDIGFGMTREDVLRAAFDFAEQSKIKNNFNQTKRAAGKDWFLGFIERNPLSLRKPQGLSRPRAEGLNPVDVQDYFDKLRTALTEAGTVSKPQMIYNVDETGCAMNNRQTQKVVAKTGSKLVVKQTSVERGELVTIVACCNATGQYIPPMAIFKGKKFHKEWEEGFPPGTRVSMSESGWINEELFLVWLQHFQNNRIPGCCVLVLDGHASHKSLPVLQYCEKNNITLMALPSHTTHRLQPLDRSFFKPFKAFYDKECNAFMTAFQSERKITKFNFGRLFNRAWCKAATLDNAVNGFRSTGIYPLNTNVVNDWEYRGLQTSTVIEPLSISLTTSPGSSGTETHQLQRDRCSTPIPEPNSTDTLNSSLRRLLPTPEKTQKGLNRARKQRAEILTSPAAIKDAQERLRRKNARNAPRRISTAISRQERVVNNQCSSTSDTSSSSTLSSSGDEEETSSCGFCLKSYNCPNSSKLGDWIQCMTCRVWYHENCVGGKGKKKFLCGKCL